MTAPPPATARPPCVLCGTRGRFLVLVVPAPGVDHAMLDLPKIDSSNLPADLHIHAGRWAMICAICGERPRLYDELLSWLAYEQIDTEAAQ